MHRNAGAKFILMKKITFEHYCLIFSCIIRVTIKRGVASLKLPAKYPQLPAVPIGQIESLISGIYLGDVFPTRGLPTPTPRAGTYTCEVG